MRTLRPQVRLDVPAHPRFKGFEAFAAREILPRLAEMEDERRSVVRRAKLVAIATALIVFGLVALGVLGAMGTIGVVVSAIVLALMGLFVGGWPLLSFSARMGDFLLAKTCAHAGLRHSGANPDLPLDRFRAASLLPRSEKHRFEDGVACADPDLAFAAAEVTLTDSTADSDGRSDENTVWRGFVMEMPTPRRFAGRTLVLPKRASFDQFFDRRESQPVDLGFAVEDGLEVRATNPGEARAVLTQRVMRRLAELGRRLGRERPALALIDSHVLLTIETGRNRFGGGSVFEPIDAARRIDPVLADVAQLLALAEALRDALAQSRGARPA